MVLKFNIPLNVAGEVTLSHHNLIPTDCQIVGFHPAPSAEYIFYQGANYGKGDLGSAVVLKNDGSVLAMHQEGCNEIGPPRRKGNASDVWSSVSDANAVFGRGLLLSTIQIP